MQTGNSPSFKFIFFLSIGYALISCSNKKDIQEDNITVEHFEYVIEEPEPPYEQVSSQFKAVQEWLHHICKTEKPGKPNLDYSFSLFESPNEYTLCLTGVKTYDEIKYRSVTRIEWEPDNMYFILPQSEYKSLTPEQVREQLFTQLKAFTTTNDFKHSFFHQAQSIKAEWKGELWTR